MSSSFIFLFPFSPSFKSFLELSQDTSLWDILLNFQEANEPYSNIILFIIYLLSLFISSVSVFIPSFVKTVLTPLEIGPYFQPSNSSFIFSFERENEISSDIANNILNTVSERLVIA